MTAIAIYQVDAFTSAVFSGNPAAVCPLENWLDASVMQAVAAENNLAETAFIVAGGEDGADYGYLWDNDKTGWMRMDVLMSHNEGTKYGPGGEYEQEDK